MRSEQWPILLMTHKKPFSGREAFGAGEWPAGEKGSGPGTVAEKSLGASPWR